MIHKLDKATLTLRELDNKLVIFLYSNTREILITAFSE